MYLLRKTQDSLVGSWSFEFYWLFDYSIIIRYRFVIWFRLEELQKFNSRGVPGEYL